MEIITSILAIISFIAIVVIVVLYVQIKKVPTLTADDMQIIDHIMSEAWEDQIRANKEGKEFNFYREVFQRFNKTRKK